jgi:hypothetical protein
MVSSCLITLLLYLFTNYAIAENRAIILPFYSDIAAKYYVKSNTQFEFYLKPEYDAKAIPISPQEASVPIQGQQFVGPDVPNFKYYEIGRFTINSILYKLIIYNRQGDGATNPLNIQINSYAENNNLKDALVLESRYGYEVYDYFTKFSVDSNSIFIDYYYIALYEIPEDGDLGDAIEIKNPVPEIYLQERYQIDNGTFKLVYKDDKGIIYLGE